MSLVITCWFAASYVNAEIDRYYLVPALIAVTWIAVLAAPRWTRSRHRDPGRCAALRRRPTGATPAIAAARDRRRPAAASGDVAAGALVLEIALSVSLLIPTLEALPERSRTLDHSADTSAGAWARAAMATVEPDAVILSWWSYSTPLWYVQLIEGLRPDVWIVDDRTRLDQTSARSPT